MGDLTVLGYVVMAARKAGVSVRTEVKLVDAMKEVMKEFLPTDALELYMEWVGYDEEEEYKAELEKAAEELGKVVA